MCVLTSTSHNFFSADYHDDENIQELILYQFPPDSPFSVELSDHFAFSEDENMAMLLLPRKECQYASSPICPIKLFTGKFTDNGSNQHIVSFIHRSSHSTTDSQSLPNPLNHPLLKCLRLSNDPERPNSRKRLDNLFSHPRIYRSRPPSLLHSSAKLPKLHNTRNPERIHTLPQTFSSLSPLSLICPC